jgi:PIN domain nuclease of toxin-antitoxin system
MRYFIDTNILLRWKTELSLLSKDVLTILEDTDNLIYMSSVSVQEIFILLQSKKIYVKEWLLPKDVFNTIENEFGIILNYVKKEHLLTFAKIELVTDHSDPFDRIIISQAITEQMPLISSDTKFKNYRKQKLDLIFNE